MNLCWYQKARVITLSCGIKIGSTFFRLVRMHAYYYRQTCDRQTELRSQDRASIVASHGNKLAQAVC